MTYQAPHYDPTQFAPQPPRKRRLLRSFVIGATIVFGLFVAAVAVLSVAIADTAQEAGKAGATAAPAGRPDTRLDKNKPTEVKVGQAVTKGRHRLESGWRLRETAYISSFELARGQVTNVSEQAGAAFIEVKVYKGKRMLADISCHSPELEPGETGDLSCYSGAEYVPGWTRVTVSAAY